MTRKRRKLPLILGGVVLLYVIGALAVGGAKKTKPEPTTPAAAVVAEMPEQSMPTEPVEAETEELPPLDIEDIVSILESNVGTVYENYEVWVSDEKDSVILYIWQDGISSGCYKASKGIAPYTTQWDQIVNGMKNLSISVQNLFDSAGRNDISASVVVRNDANPDSVLLMVNRGRVLLNAAE